MHTTPFKKKPAHTRQSLWLAFLIVSLTCFLQNTPQAEAWTYVPKGFTVTVRNLKVSAGAGFIVALTGDIMTMPGLPKVPAAEKIDVDENGKISGLF